MVKTRDALKNSVKDFELIVVDDGSTDNTPEILTSLKKEFPELRVIRHEMNLGVGIAMKHGFEAAENDFAFLNSADLPFNPNDLKKMIPFLGEADFVVASRQNRSANTFFRKITSMGNYFLIKLFFGTRVSDFQHAQLYKRRVLNAVKIESRSSFVAPELMIKALHNGFKFKEIKLPFHPRKKGKAKCGSVKTILQTFSDIVRFFVKWNLLNKWKE